MSFSCNFLENLVYFQFLFQISCSQHLDISLMSWISKRWKIQGIPPLNISQYVAERIKKQKKQKNKISLVKKWKKVWKTQGHQFLYLMVCLTHVYMADIKHLLVLLNAQEGKHPCSKRLPFLRKWEAEGKRFLHQL